MISDTSPVYKLTSHPFMRILQSRSFLTQSAKPKPILRTLRNAITLLTYSSHTVTSSNLKYKFDMKVGGPFRSTPPTWVH